MAIILEKDVLDGYPCTIFRPWGYIMDLPRVAAEGPLAGLLLSTTQKGLKDAKKCDSDTHLIFNGIPLKRDSIKFPTNPNER